MWYIRYRESGSSPRTWGTHAEPGRVWRAPQVHPHVHGERMMFSMLCNFSSGSSPRTWGTLAGTRLPCCARRFIPTYMGNADVPGMSRSAPAVHPHVHGERLPACLPPLQAGGSSPRTWGTPDHVARRVVGLRFIPTYMGNAGNAVVAKFLFAVHPHVHGERRWVYSDTDSVCGSSPRTWGTHTDRVVDQQRRRFIPTYMGNASIVRTSTTVMTVHPHVHGERGMATVPNAERSGSSPRTWGTQVIAVGEPLVYGFIPTYMGNA